MMYGAVNALIRQMNGELNNVQSVLWVSILPCRCVHMCARSAYHCYKQPF